MNRNFLESLAASVKDQKMNNFSRKIARYTCSIDCGRSDASIVTTWTKDFIQNGLLSFTNVHNGRIGGQFFFLCSTTGKYTKALIKYSNAPMKYSTENRLRLAIHTQVHWQLQMLIKMLKSRIKLTLSDLIQIKNSFETYVTMEPEMSNTARNLNETKFILAQTKQHTQDHRATGPVRGRLCGHLNTDRLYGW
jgi:hypothetical protein